MNFQKSCLFCLNKWANICYIDLSKNLNQNLENNNFILIIFHINLANNFGEISNFFFS